MNDNTTGAVQAAPHSIRRSYDYYVSEGNRVREMRDRTNWALGDLAVAFCADFDISPGRPPADDSTPTLAALAREWELRPPQVSEFHSVADFYPLEARQDDLSWSHHNMARRNSGDSLDNALELLDKARTNYMSAEDFRRWLKGDYAVVVVERGNWLDILRATWSASVPLFARKVRVTFSPVKEDSE